MWLIKIPVTPLTRLFIMCSHKLNLVHLRTVLPLLVKIFRFRNRCDVSRAPFLCWFLETHWYNFGAWWWKECMSSRRYTCIFFLFLSLLLLLSFSPSTHHGWPPADLRASIWLRIAWEHCSFSTLIKAAATVSQSQTYSVCLHAASLPWTLLFFSFKKHLKGG